MQWSSRVGSGWVNRIRKVEGDAASIPVDASASKQKKKKNKITLNTDGCRQGVGGGSHTRRAKVGISKPPSLSIMVVKLIAQSSLLLIFLHLKCLMQYQISIKEIKLTLPAAISVKCFLTLFLLLLGSRSISTYGCSIPLLHFSFFVHSFE